MSLVAQAYAAAEKTAAPGAAATPDMLSAPPVNPPSAMETIGLNMLLVLILVVLFYVLLIIPQQKRFKKHRAMLDGMKKGDKVLTSGGLVGTVDKITQGDDEVVVDLGHNVKVTALRSTLQLRVERTAAPKKKAS